MKMKIHHVDDDNDYDEDDDDDDDDKDNDLGKLDIFGRFI